MGSRTKGLPMLHAAVLDKIQILLFNKFTRLLCGRILRGTRGLRMSPSTPAASTEACNLYCISFTTPVISIVPDGAAPGFFQRLGQTLVAAYLTLWLLKCSDLQVHAAKEQTGSAERRIFLISAICFLFVRQRLTFNRIQPSSWWQQVTARITCFEAKGADTARDHLAPRSLTTTRD